MNLIETVINKIRNAGTSLGLTSNPYKILYYGTFNEISYSNFKHDPSPIIFVMYSGVKYTHGLNINYMRYEDKLWFGDLIIFLKKRNAKISGRMLYSLLKAKRPSIVKTCYRKYFTNFIVSSKMVCAGFTPMGRLSSTSRDNFVRSLDKKLKSSFSLTSIFKKPVSEEELRQRIIEAKNATQIGANAVPQQGIQSATTTITKIVGDEEDGD